jgi:hypothetical protein
MRKETDKMLFKKTYLLLGLVLLLVDKGSGQQAFGFQGQASAWANVNPGNDLPLWMGARYIPQFDFKLLPEGGKQFDLEFSANISGQGGLHPFDSLSTDGKIKPYRAWGRFATDQFELRLGLQKINFGSATMLRPLMWFDQVDPRDPLQLTDGVWGLLGRYFFLNNANIWLWGLYGNEGPKTWELGTTTKKTPEFGGRFQMPVPRGEAALTFHHRKADLSIPYWSVPSIDNIPENRYGFDVKLDVEVGLWLEGTWINKRLDVQEFTNQEILNLGADYTFNLGNGLHMIVEQLLFSYDNEPFAFKNNTHFSATSFSYPFSIFDNISTILYYDWTHKNFYSFANWQRQMNRFTFYLMGFWNPDSFQLPQQSEGAQMFAGKGFQLMIVYNH